MVEKNGILDIFCGPGGFSLGFKQAGFDIIYSSDINESAIETITYNHNKIAECTKEQNHHCAEIMDITKINKEKCGEIKSHFEKNEYRIQGIIGGPPCKGFSISNSRTRTLDNPHNSLFKDYIKLVKHFDPDFFAFENVPGIKSMGGGKIIDEIKEELHTNLGYTLGMKTLNASDYGVPQNRRRVIIIGVKPEKIKTQYVKEDRLDMELIFPKNDDMPKITVGEAINDLPMIGNGNKEEIMSYPSFKLSKYANLMRKTPDLKMESSAVFNHVNSKNGDTVLKRYENISEGGNWRDIPEDLLTNYKDKSRCHSGIYKRLRSDVPSGTINNIRKSMYIHPLQNRGLSVREAARIQSFPDWYEFKGSLNAQQQMVADAVPPLLAKAIAEQIKKIIIDN